MSKYAEALNDFKKCQHIADSLGFGFQWARMQHDRSVTAFERLKRAMNVKDWERGVRWYLSEAVYELEACSGLKPHLSQKDQDSYADGVSFAIQCALNVPHEDEE